MRVGFAQINPTVGDLTGNFEKIAGAYQRLTSAGAELVITPELAVTGYPPQDLIFKSRFVRDNCDVIDRLQDRKSTRLNSSHANISYAVFCLKKKNNSLIQIYSGRPALLLL